MSEILGALFKYLLAIFAITAVLVIAYQALGGSEVEAASGDITTMQANITEFYADQTAPTLDTTTADVVAEGMIPAQMVSGTGKNATVTGPWGGMISFSSETAQASGEAGATFGVIIPNIPPTACKKLITTVLPSMDHVDLEGSGTTIIASDPKFASEVGTDCGNSPQSIGFFFLVPGASLSTS